MSETQNDAGTFFLSYICDIGIIDSYDTIMSNCVDGKLLKDYWGIPKDFLVFVKMAQDGETLTIKYGPADLISSDECNNSEDSSEYIYIEDENENEYSYEYVEDQIPWWEKEGVKEKVVKVQINYF